MNRSLAFALMLCFMACSQQLRRPYSARFDQLREIATDMALKGLKGEDVQVVRRDIEGSRAYWNEDPSYKLVRAQVDRLSGVRTIVRLEIAGAGGKGYHSVWFVDTGGQVLEFSTGPESQGLQRGVLPRKEWREYANYLADLPTRKVPSLVSPRMFDAVFYFFCSQVGHHEVSFIVEAMPSNIPQWALIARTLKLSKFKKLPREFKGVPHGKAKTS